MKKTKITKRSDYAKASGYDVTLSVTYRRVRKVRALDEKQAAEFAQERERQYAARYYNSVSHIAYEITAVEVEGVCPASLRLGGVEAQPEQDDPGEGDGSQEGGEASG